jgi:hypothetical protein
MTASQNPDCNQSLGDRIGVKLQRNMTAPTQVLHLPAQAAWKVASLRRPATRSDRRIRVPSLKNTLTFLRLGNIQPEARVRRNIIGS